MRLLGIINLTSSRCDLGTGFVGSRSPTTCFAVKMLRAAVVACGAAGAGAARGAATKAVKRAPFGLHQSQLRRPYKDS